MNPVVAGNWTGWIGSTVKISGLYPQDRTVASRSSRLYRLFSAYRKPTQRFYYTLKVYPCSRMKIVSAPSEPLALSNLNHVLTLNPNRGIRVSFECVMVLRDEKRSRIYVLDKFDPQQTECSAYPLKILHYSKVYR